MHPINQLLKHAPYQPTIMSGLISPLYALKKPNDQKSLLFAVSH
jgi:hypothetical protein